MNLKGIHRMDPTTSNTWQFNNCTYPAYLCSKTTINMIPNNSQAYQCETVKIKHESSHHGNIEKCIHIHYHNEYDSSKESSIR